MTTSAILIPVILCVSLFAQTSPAAEAAARVLERPPAEPANAFYVSNRPPLLASPFAKLPIGAIRAEGWLAGQLELEAEGFSGRLTEISPWCDAKTSAWVSPTGEGERGWEELPYWLKGFGDLGYVLRDDRIIAEARRWIEGILSSQGEDGWFGPRSNKTLIDGSPDVWPNMVALDALQSFHEATGDARIVPFMTKYFRWQLSVPAEKFLLPFWQKMRAGDNLESVFWLYNRTGEAWLLDLARKIHERTANWTEGIPTWHGVNITQCFRQPAQFYQLSHDPRHLAAAERNYAQVMGIYGQVPGGMFGADENCRPGYTDPRQAAESCSIAEFMFSFERILKITGDPLHADRCEDAALNSFPACMTPDLKGLHYLTAPNMVQLDKENKSPGLQNGGCMLAYDPHSYRCCQHNIAHGWPYYAEHLWLATAGNGLAAVLYAAGEVRAKAGDGTEVRIRETTDYPFGEEIEFAIATPKPVAFPLYLRIPGWCRGARVEVNGKALDVRPEPARYVAIERVWSDGDAVRLVLPMRISVRVWEKNMNALSIDRGPLTYSLRIGEKWVRYGGTDKWPALEVYPTTPWNYGLVIDTEKPDASLAVTRKPGPVPRQPFAVDAAPIEIAAKAKKIPEWQMEGGLVGLLQQSPVRSDAPVETVTLIPMGCARLRISAFPRIGEGPDARAWTAPPPPPPASHVHDSYEALRDGIVPRNSNDHDIPRFTWWDHKGTTEWVQYDFDAPRTLRESEVYWFDDTGQGQCRVPASWRLLVPAGERAWRPVEGASAYGVERDRFNRVTFTPVAVKSIRLEVKLRPDVSGGILEWRVK